MKEFAGRTAVITGGGSGIGRALAQQLVAEGCNVGICDVSAEAMAETKALCNGQGLPQGMRVSTHVADVADERQLIRVREEIAAEHHIDHIHLLFNNAGVSGGGSLFTNSREQWERTFNICWGGVYGGVRTFLDMLVRAPEALIVNTSSVNGFWAALGPEISHTAYSAAKFAVRGFTEALMTDLRLNAPHVRCAVVMPGHIGTSIVSNTRKMHGGGANEISAMELQALRVRLAKSGVDTSSMSDATVAAAAADVARAFIESAPTTATDAARIILDGIKMDRWRILVGPDAYWLDEHVRATPDEAYTKEFHKSLVRATGWRLG